jgi:N-acetylmuramoyl-L-alanine amidase
MSNYYWIIDAGHGGVRNGMYVTAPAKMYRFPDGYSIYEGVVNRLTAKALCAKLDEAGIDYGLVYDEIEDTPLHKRAALVNTIYTKRPNAISLSIHSNAGGGKGSEIFTSIGQNKSDIVADYFIREYKKMPFTFRADTTDGDHDKEARLYMVGYLDNGVWKGPKCPAILVENLFFDNRLEAEFLNSPFGQEEFAKTMFNAITKIENEKPI